MNDISCISCRIEMYKELLEKRKHEQELIDKDIKDLQDKISKLKALEKDKPAMLNEAVVDG